MAGVVVEPSGVGPLVAGEPGPDLAERLGVWWRGVQKRHEGLVRLAGRLAIAGVVVAVPVVVLAFVFVPGMFESIPVLAGVLWFLAQVVVLSRSRTLPYGTISRLYGLGASVAMPVAVTEVAVRNVLGFGILDDRDAVLIAAPVEELGKLAPLVIMTIVGWNRVRRMGVGDFLVVGAAAGSGFELVEDSIRRIASTPGMLSVLSPNQGNPDYGFGLFPGSMSDGIHEVAPHGVGTAIIAAGIGLAVVHRGRRGWRWVIPIVLAVWVMFEHANYNNATSLTNVLPGPVTGLYAALGNGHLDRYLLLGLIIVAIAVDHRAIRLVEPEALPLPRTPTARPPQRFVEEFRLLGRALRAGPGALVTALRVAREQRELALGIYRAHGRPARLSALRSQAYENSARLARLLAAAGALGVLAALALARTTVTSGGTGAGGAFLAGLLRALGDWWNGLSWLDKAMLIATLLSLFGAALAPEELALIGMRYFTRWMLRAGLDSRLGRAGYAAARYLSRFADRTIALPEKNVHHTFSNHLSDFKNWFDGPVKWNKHTKEVFERMLKQYIDNPNTIAIEGRYHGNFGTHFFDPNTGMDVFRTSDGRLLTGHILNEKQTASLLERGWVW